MGVIKCENDSEWEVPTFFIPKKMERSFHFLFVRMK